MTVINLTFGGKRLRKEYGEQTRAVCENLADLLHLTGQHADAQSLFEHGLALADPGPAGRLARARMGRKIGNTLVPRHAHDATEIAFGRADDALGDENRPMDPASRSEWLRLQADRTLLYYWMNQPDKIQALVERMRPVLERGEVPAERAQVFRALQLAHMRMSRYVVSDEILGYSAECLAAQRLLNDPAGLNFAVFMRGFVWLFRGELDLAEAQLREALELAERLGDITVETRSLNYLSVVCRKRGDADGAEKWVERTLKSAEKAGMPEYVAQGRSNLAWIAWKRGRFAEAESIARAASDWIRETPAIRAIYPLPWEALFPLLDIDLRNEDLSRSVDDARLLLMPEGQRLPDALADELQAGIDHFDRGEVDSTRDRLQRSVALAQRMGFL